MIKNVLSRLALICVTVCSFTIAGCSDKDLYDPEKVPGYVAPKPTDIDFSTSRNVKLNLNYDADGFISTVDFYAEYPLTNTGSLRTDITPVAGAINVAGITELTRTIPSYIDELFAYSPSLFVPLLSSAKITNGVASFQPEIITVETETRTTRAGNAGDLWGRASVYQLKRKNDFYAETSGDNIQYDIIAPDHHIDIPTEVKTYIGNTFRESKRLPAISEFVRDATFTVVKGSEGNETAKIYLSVLYSGCSIKNSLSYFVYTGDKDFDQLTKSETEKLEVITLLQLANANTNSFSHMKIGVTPGNYIQLLYKNEEGKFVEDFPVGAKIGWRLNVNSFDDANFTIKRSEARFSVPVWNDDKWGDANYIGGTDSNHTIQFEVSDNNGDIFKCFGFEDVRYNSDEDYNDLIFHVYSDPADGLSKLPEVNPEEIIKWEAYKGILAFEDNWPEKGDYDLNDVVVKYNSNVAYIAQPNKSYDATVKKVVDTFSFIHTGAIFRNAFSYKVNISPSAIKKITILDENKNSEKDYTNQITADGEGFIIDLCPNVKNVIDPMAEVKVPQVYAVTMEFNDGAVKQKDFSKHCAPYNPFISPAEKPGVEVHLPMYPPTTRAKESYFGTEDDRSDGKTIWYVSGENIQYPFALHLAGATKFNIPQEEHDISTTYPNYLKWVESGMTDFKDWYK